MSILTKRQILERISKGEIKIRPHLDSFQLQAHAIDLRLGYTFLVPKKWHLTKKGREALKVDYFDRHVVHSYFETVELEQGQYFELLAGEYILVSTLETISLTKEVMAILYPRSSTNRKGLSVDLTGVINAGYEGQLVIPIRNNTDSQIIKLYPGERFCQLIFESLDEPAETRIGRYQNKDIIEGFIIKQFSKDLTEANLITKGDIRKLKEKYSVNKGTRTK
ncbi:MAG: dCTP deaminase [Patescibacteria group bacterium]